MEHDNCIPGDRDASEKVTNMDDNYCMPCTKDPSEQLDQTGLDIINEMEEDYMSLILPENIQDARKQGAMSSAIDEILLHSKISGVNIKIEPDHENFIIPIQLEEEVQIVNDEGKLKELFNSLQHNEVFKMKGEVVNEEFTSDGDVHMHTHTGERPNKFDVCRKGFVQRRTLSNHVLTYTRVLLPHKCGICGKLYTHKGILSKHMLTHPEYQKNHKSCMYENRIIRKGSLKKHILIHSMKKGNLSKHVSAHKTCGESFVYNNDICNGAPINWERPYKCEKCGKEFRRHHALRRHLEIHTVNQNVTTVRSVDNQPIDKSIVSSKQNEKEAMSVLNNEGYPCSFCETGFLSTFELHLHLLTHFNGRPQDCDSCVQGFTSEELLVNHLINHIESSVYDSCAYVIGVQKEKQSVISNNKNWDTACNLSSREYFHQGTTEDPINKQPDKCDVWPKGINTTQNIPELTLSHTGERPHKCGVCGKGFIGKSHLAQHMLTHTGERPHKCCICGKGYTTMSNLKTHMLTHTGQRPHKCVVCGKGFTQKAYIKIHMLTHTGERPHKCGLCGKGYTQKGDLRNHMLTHTG